MIKLNSMERNHISIVFFQFFKSIYKEFLFIILAYTFLNDKIGNKFAVLIIIIGIVADILISFIKWYGTIFYFKENSIFYQRGVFNITRSEIPFEKVNTVDISQNLACKILQFQSI